MNSLRICHVIHNTEFGGTETMLYKLLLQLSGQHEMSVISLLKCGEIGDRIRSLGIPVFAMECARDQQPRPAGLVRLVRKLQELQPQVVQTWAYHADLCGGVAARLATKSAVLWNVRHGTLDPRLDSRNTLRSARLCGRLSRWVPDRILLNAHSAIDVHAQVGYQRDKMQVLPNGFDAEEFRPLEEAREEVRRELHIPADAPVVGMCGRFHPHKGQAEFVKVAKRIKAEWPSTHFLIAGHSCDSSNIELTTWIENAGLANQFRLLGGRADVPRIINAFDVYLLPSITEGMPNAVGEAMSCGVNVVATDVGDARHLMGDCGTVVPSQDIPAMAAAVAAFLSQGPSARRALGARARTRIRNNFAIEAIASKYVSAWQETYERRVGKSRSRTLAMPSTVPSPPGVVKLPSRPKLVHVTTIALTQWLFLRGQNEFMAEQGFEVHAVSSPGPYLARLRERDPLTTHGIAISRRIAPLQDAVSAYRLWRLFRTLQPEIVQLSTPKAALLGAIAAKAAGVPVRIYQVRGLSSESESGLKRRVFQQFERWTAKLCNGHLLNARSLLTYARRAKILNGGLVAGMGTSNGVDLQRFRGDAVRAAELPAWDETGDAKIVIGYVGRLTRDKGLEDLYLAWRNLRDDFPDARLLLVGPWESENAVSEACRAGLVSDPRVIITGTQHDVVPFYKRMDIFAFPSHGTEGFPNAPMEAAAMGIPVVCTRVVGCVDAVIHGVTGEIIAPRSPAELESVLREYLLNPKLRFQHGQAGYERIRAGFVPEDLWSEFRDYYFHLLRREGLPLPTPLEKWDTERKAA